MSNTIQIKHGSGIPDGRLRPYELGYSEDYKSLYIGAPLKNGALGKAIPLSDFVPLKSTSQIMIDVQSSTILNLKTSSSPNPYIAFSNNDGILGYYGINATAKKPVFCDTSSHQIALLNNDGGITVEGALIVGPNNYGSVDPNTAKINGTQGQLYFVIAE